MGQVKTIKLSNYEGKGKTLWKKVKVQIINWTAEFCKGLAVNCVLSKGPLGFLGESAWGFECLRMAFSQSYSPQQQSPKRTQEGKSAKFEAQKVF